MWLKHATSHFFFFKVTFDTTQNIFFQFSKQIAKNLLYICILINYRNITMARPIKETPVLRGRDAENFAKRIATPPPVSREEKEAARKAYEAFKAISTFPM